MSKQIKKLLEGMVKQDASDLHMKSGQKPNYRLNGKLRQVDMPALSTDDIEKANDAMMPDRLEEQLEEQGSADYSYALSEFQRFRVNAYYQRGRLSLAIRKISAEPPTFDELELPDILNSIIEARRGLVLVTGITGSGKSSTLAAMINSINSSRREHILTIEDPVEFLFEDKKCLVDQIEVGYDVNDFHRAVRNALRQDPDVIMFGELRDRETVETSLHAVESGHLVFATLHTPDAKQTILRLLHFFGADEHHLIKEDLALNLHAVICQRLVRRIDKEGRVACCEILIGSPIIKKLIREDRFDDMQQVMNNGEDGMQSFDGHMVELVKAKIVDIEEALKLVHDEAAFRRALKGKSAGGDRRALIGFG